VWESSVEIFVYLCAVNRLVLFVLFESDEIIVAVTL
jgi:hypothetical protein